MPYISRSAETKQGHEFLSLTVTLADLPDPYLVAANLFHQILPETEEVFALFDDRVADLEAAAFRQSGGLDCESTQLLRQVSAESAALTNWLYDVEFGSLFGEEANDVYGAPGVPLLAFVLLKVVLETDWRRAGLRQGCRHGLR